MDDGIRARGLQGSKWTRTESHKGNTAGVTEGITAATQDARSGELLPLRSHGTGVVENSQGEEKTKAPSDT